MKKVEMIWKTRVEFNGHTIDFWCDKVKDETRQEFYIEAQEVGGKYQDAIWTTADNFQDECLKRIGVMIKLLS